MPDWVLLLLHALTELTVESTLMTPQELADHCCGFAEQPLDQPEEVANRVELVMKEHRDWEGQCEAARLIIQQTGYPDWCKWSLANWGTIWNVVGGSLGLKTDGEDSEAMLGFYTAWSPPLPIIVALSKRYPDFEFTLGYCDPNLSFARNKVQIVNGQCDHGRFWLELCDDDMHAVSLTEVEMRRMYESSFRSYEIDGREVTFDELQEVVQSYVGRGSTTDGGPSSFCYEDEVGIVAAYTTWLLHNRDVWRQVRSERERD